MPPIPGEHTIDRHERALLGQARDELPILSEEPAVEPTRSLVGGASQQKAARRVDKVGQEQVLELHVGGAVSRNEASVAEVLAPAHVPGEVAGIQHVPVTVDVLRKHERPGCIGSTVERVDERRERLRVPEVIGVEEHQIPGCVRRPRRARIPGLRDAEVRVAHQLHARVQGEGTHDVRSVVGRPVVDHDHLEPQEGLGKHRTERLPDEPGAVVEGDHNGDDRRLA